MASGKGSFDDLIELQGFTFRREARLVRKHYAEADPEPRGQHRPPGRAKLCVWRVLYPIKPFLKRLDYYQICDYSWTIQYYSLI